MSIKNKYKNIGIIEYYLKYGNIYRNPHEKQLNIGLPQFISNNKINTQIKCEGLDAYTNIAYFNRTGKACIIANIESYNFVKKYDTIICSYALHLLDFKALLKVLTSLKQISKQLIVITPHDKPTITIDMGWNMVVKNNFKGCKQKYILYHSI